MPPPSEWPTRVARSWPSDEQQVAQAGGEAAQRVVAAARLRLAVAGQVGGDHGVVARQRLDHRRASSRRARHAVDQQQHRALAAAEVADRAPVDGHGLDSVTLARSGPRSVGTPYGARSGSDAATVTIPILSRPHGRRARRTDPPRGALIVVVAIGLLATVAAALLSDRRGERRSGPPRMGRRRRRCPTPSRSRSPAARRRCS